MTDDADNHDRLLLIVEDDDSFSATLRRSFERRGYTVVSAANPDQMADVQLPCRAHSGDDAVLY